MAKLKYLDLREAVINTCLKMNEEGINQGTSGNVSVRTPEGFAAIDFARSRGARALEAYPMATQEGVEITWGELHVGSRNSFAAAA